MTTKQKEAIHNAQIAFVAALEAGIHEDDVIEALCEASLQHRKNQMDATMRIVSRLLNSILE